MPVETIEPLLSTPFGVDSKPNTRVHELIKCLAYEYVWNPTRFEPSIPSRISFLSKFRVRLLAARLQTYLADTGRFQSLEKACGERSQLRHLESIRESWTAISGDGNRESKLLISTVVPRGKLTSVAWLINSHSLSCKHSIHSLVVMPVFVLFDSVGRLVPKNVVKQGP